MLLQHCKLASTLKGYLGVWCCPGGKQAMHLGCPSLPADKPLLVTWSLGIILCKHPELHSCLAFKALNLCLDALCLQQIDEVSLPVIMCSQRCSVWHQLLTSPGVRKPATSITVVKSLGNSSGLLTPSRRADTPVYHECCCSSTNSAQPGRP